jgi:hypothetical protein
MKRYILILGFFASSACGPFHLLQGQTLSPRVIATAGNSFQNANIRLDWTLGELCTHTYMTGNTIITEGFHQPVVLNLRIDLTAFLQGPWSGSGMSTGINPILPLNQPFYPTLPYFGNASPKWYYNGGESVASIPNSNVVDWVLVELRDATSASTATNATVKARKAAFILNNGHIVDTEGSSMLNFPVTISNNLFVAIYHRNHLGILSANPLINSGGIYSYNFSTSVSQVFGGINGHVQLSAGTWGMKSGDGNADGVVTDNDKINVWALQAGIPGYLSSDYSLNGQTDNNDKLMFWLTNKGSTSQIPE